MNLLLCRHRTKTALERWKGQSTRLHAMRCLLAAHGMEGVLEDTHLAQGRAAAAQVAQMRAERALGRREKTHDKVETQRDEAVKACADALAARDVMREENTALRSALRDADHRVMDADRNAREARAKL